MVIKKIENEQDYQEALKRLEVIFDDDLSEPETDELEALAILIETYEDKYYPID